jgi:hypothetical protein
MLPEIGRAKWRLAAQGHEHPGLFRRILAAVGGALKGKLLGKSMNRFSGSDEYWHRVIAAQRGWPAKQHPELDPV